MDYNRKITIKVDKYPELIFLDRVMTFVAILYSGSQCHLSDPIKLFVEFLKQVRVNVLLSLLNRDEFTPVVLQYFCSRLNVSSITHVHAELYSLPVSLCKSTCTKTPVMSYFIFFDPEQLVRFITSSYKLYYLHDGKHISVEQYQHGNDKANAIENEYLFLLNRYESSSYERASVRDFTKSQYRRSNIACPTESVINCRSNAVSFNSVPLMPDSFRTAPEKSPLSEVYEIIIANKEKFMLLTYIVQVLESFQFVDSLPIAKHIDIHINRAGKTFARPKLNRSTFAESTVLH